MKHTIGCTAAAIFLVTATCSFAGIHFNSIKSDVLLQTLQEKKPVTLVDIQKKKSFLLHHFFNSLETNAYPVKTDKDTGKIKEILQALQTNTSPVIIVGPRGTRASKRAYTFLVKQGIPPERLAILEKGIRGWPAPEILLNTSGQ
ncbi:MAG: rhodanese-like domain-containing protein [Desulfobulbus sp.]|nr:MAG: rhodanese-like domain-containing protein [Desulfobulbus sp.]RUM37824.1 MAG: rhodanese-like domain-containing protein [Desulfobulbus sp.]